MVVQIAYSAFVLDISLRLAIGITTRQRFKDCKEEGGLTELRKWRWMRWVMFALGGVQPTIKLSAFKDLPFTQAIGVVWVLS